MATRAATHLFGGVRDWSRYLAAATVIGSFLGLLGPFGSYLNGSRMGVMAYWIMALWLGTTIFGVIVRPAVRAAPRPMRLAVLAGSCLVAAAILSVACRRLAAAIWPGPISGISFLDWYLETLIISAPIAAGYAWLDGQQREAGRPTAPGGSAEPVRSFMSRLPAELGRDLLALQMEDHYVRAHTSRGSTLLLLPLHQALGELREAPGLRVHRSWWVAAGAVDRAIQDGRNVRLVLRNGIQAPVSRASVAAARAAGMLGD